jgi:hypothetical protein
MGEIVEDELFLGLIVQFFSKYTSLSVAILTGQKSET